MVSVVIPVHNGERFLLKTLESVANQTYVDWEAVIVDDGSTDGSREIAFAWASSVKQRVEVIRQDNQGGATARNNGIRASRGEYIAMLDADDIWHKMKLQKQVRLLGANLEALACGSSYYFFDDSKQKVDGLVSVSWSPEMVRDWFFLVDYGPALNSTIMFRRSALAWVGLYDDSLKFAEDADLGWRLSNTGTVLSVMEPLTLYRIWSGQVHGDARLLTETMARLFDRYLRHNPPAHRHATNNLLATKGLRVMRQDPWKQGFTDIALAVLDSKDIAGFVTSVSRRRFRRWRTARARVDLRGFGIDNS